MESGCCCCYWQPKGMQGYGSCPLWGEWQGDDASSMKNWAKNVGKRHPPKRHYFSPPDSMEPEAEDADKPDAAAAAQRVHNVRSKRWEEEHIKRIEADIAADLYNTDAWLALINEANRHSADLLFLREAYERFLKIFPTAVRQPSLVTALLLACLLACLSASLLSSSSLSSAVLG